MPDSSLFKALHKVTIPSRYVLAPVLGMLRWWHRSQKQPKNPSKRPRPSYEEGELRDESIEEKMGPTFVRENLRNVIRKAAKKA